MKPAVMQINADMVINLHPFLEYPQLPGHVQYSSVEPCWGWSDTCRLILGSKNPTLTGNASRLRGRDRFRHLRTEDQNTTYFYSG